MAPTQSTPQSPVEWLAMRLSGTDPLAVRASKKLRNDELLLTGYAGVPLRMQLNDVPLWRGNHVSIRQLMQDFAQYVYLPRVKNPSVVLGAVRNGLGLLTWGTDTFGYADDWDEAAGRYLGLRGGELVDVTDENPAGLLVKPDVAQRQMEAERPPEPPRVIDGPNIAICPPPKRDKEDDEPTPPIRPSAPTRFHGTVILDAVRPGRDAGHIADELISHLSGLVGAKVRLTLEIEAEMPTGFPEHVVRTVTENGRSLKFTSQGFESE